MPRLHRVVIALAIIVSGTAAAQSDDGGETTGTGVETDTQLQGAEALLSRLESASPVLKDMAEGALRRARRSVSIGPSLGVFGGYGDGLDVALSFGIGIETFDIPVLPSVEDLKAIAKERAKAKLRQVLVESMKGQPLDPAQFEQLVAEVWDEALKEVLGMQNIRPKTMERPRLSFGLEGNYYFDAGAPGVRVRLGVGIWKLTVAGSATWLFTDPTSNVYLAPELVAHFLTSKGPRASVVDVFVRGDLEVRNRGEAHSNDMFVVGARYLLDVL